MKNIKPVNKNQIIGTKIDGERITVGGIYIPDTIKKHAMIGTVTSAPHSLCVKEKDTILFGRMSPNDIKLMDGYFFSLNEENILAKCTSDYSYIHPQHNFILVERIKRHEKIGNIYVPDKSKEMVFEGVVLTTSDNVILSGEVKEGDTVYYKQYSFYLLEVPNKEYIIVDIKDVLMKRCD